MTIDWNVDTPIPRRPAPTRARTGSARPRKGRVPAALGALLVGRARARADARVVRPARRSRPGRRARAAPRGPARHAATPTVHPLRVRWGVDRLADPTALLVDGADAFVVEPYAVSSIAVATGTTAGAST